MTTFDSGDGFRSHDMGTMAYLIRLFLDCITCPLALRRSVSFCCFTSSLSHCMAYICHQGAGSDSGLHRSRLMEGDTRGDWALKPSYPSDVPVAFLFLAVSHHSSSNIRPLPHIRYIMSSKFRFCDSCLVSRIILSRCLISLLNHFLLRQCAARRDCG